VYIGPNSIVGTGVRIHNAIILDNVVIRVRLCFASLFGSFFIESSPRDLLNFFFLFQNHACIMYSIVGSKCTVGEWTRLEGDHTTDPFKGGTEIDKQRLGITVFGIFCPSSHFGVEIRYYLSSFFF
jgi:ADP-glucose pyrophosphorylase